MSREIAERGEIVASPRRIRRPPGNQGRNMEVWVGIGVVLGLSSLSAAAAAAEPPCVPATAAEGVARQPPGLRAAVAALLAETARPGKPWSCRGGEIDAELLAEGKVSVRVRLAGASQPVERVVDDVEDVVPLGRALLALPQLEAAAPAEPPAEKPAEKPAGPADQATTPTPKAPSPPAESAEPAPSSATGGAPTVLLDAVLDVRYAAPTEVLLAGPRLAATLPLGAAGTWTVGLWARGGAPLATFRRGPSLGEVAGGAAVGARGTVESFEVRGSILGGVGVAVRDLPRPEPSEAKVSPRIGLQGDVAYPARGIVRALASTGVEVAPTDLGASGRSSAAPFPGLSAGLALGIEVALP